MRDESVAGLTLKVPAHFDKVAEDELYDPGTATNLRLQRIPANGRSLDQTLADAVKSEHFGGAKKAGFDRARLAAKTRMPLPDGWRGSELLASASEGVSEQRHRLVVFGRVAGGEHLVGTFYHPTALSQSYEVSFQAMLRSIRVLAQADSGGPSAGDAE
jgi:hypothetical protein